MSNLWKDFRLALHSLRNNPGFAAVAIGTLALGIGATTAIFSVVRAVLLRPLPYRDQGTLVTIWSDLTARDVKNFPLPPGDMYDLRLQGTLFEQTAAFATFQQPLRAEGAEPEMIKAAVVTPNFFTTLGARTALGRDFRDDDGVPQPPPQAAPGAPPVAPPPPLPTIAVLSYEFWQRRYGGDPSIVGKNIQLGNNNPAHVVGVLAPGFELLFPAGRGIERRPDLYTALRINFETGSRINVFLRLVGRLKPGVTVDQAQAQINTLVSDLRKRFPIKETAGLRWRVESMHENLVAEVKPTILALMGAGLFVLLIACSNVANLLLVRAAARERELAVRSALGGSRWALLRQMLVESLVIAGSGAVAGIALAWAGIRLLLSIGPENLPRLDQVGLDPLVLGFGVLAAFLSAIVFGVVPAIRAARVPAAEALRSGGRNAGLAGGTRLRSAVVVAEVALAFVLLVGAGLMIRSFVAITRADPGYDPDGVLTFFMPNLGRPSPAARAAFVQQLTDRLKGLPGVTGVTGVNPLPLDGGSANMRWGPPAAATDPRLFQQANLHVVQPGYFDVMGTRVIEGRSFTAQDNDTLPRQLVVDLNFARKAFPGQSAVGKEILARIRTNEAEPWTIIGVVAHQRHESLAHDGPETVFVPDGTFFFGATGRWVIRTSGDPNQLVGPVRAAIRELDPTLAITELQPMAVFLDKARAPTRFALVLIGVFSVIAVVLGAVGLFGVLATLVRQRTPEIGVRMAFGAPHSSILRLFVGYGMRLSVLGVVIGVTAALGLTRVMQNMLVGVEATDPLTFVAMATLFLAVAVAACMLPARQAARLDPNAALRED